MGNPVLRQKLDQMARIDFLFSMGLINGELHQELVKACNVLDENNYFAHIATSLNKPCSTLLLEHAPSVAFNITGNHGAANGRLFDVVRDPCPGKMEDLYAGKEVHIYIHTHIHIHFIFFFFV